MSSEAREQDEKQRLRAAWRARRRAIPAPQRDAWSRALRTRLQASDLYRRARAVHLFIGAIDGEVDTRPLVADALAQGKAVICPRVNKADRRLEHRRIGSLDDLAPAPMGLAEPDPARTELVDASFPDLILVPGLIFDRQGYRLGFGAGYYDRFLSEVDAPTVGLAFAMQVVAEVPREPHDVPVRHLATEIMITPTRLP